MITETDISTMEIKDFENTLDSENIAFFEKTTSNSHRYIDFSNYDIPEISKGISYVDTSYEMFFPPTIPDYVEPYSTLYNVTASMYHNLINYFTSLPIEIVEIVQDSEYSLKGIYFDSNNNEIYFYCNLFSTKIPSNYALEIQRRSGDIISFNKLFRQIQSALQSEVIIFSVDEKSLFDTLPDLTDIKENKHQYSVEFDIILSMIDSPFICRQIEGIRNLLNYLNSTSMISIFSEQYIKLLINLFSSENYTIRRYVTLLFQKLLSDNNYKSIFKTHTTDLKNILTSNIMKNTNQNEPLVKNTVKHMEICLDKLINVF